MIQTTFPVPDIPEIHQYVDWWLPHVKQYLVAAEGMAKSRAAGKIVTFYDNGVPIIDLSGIRLRSLPWMMWNTNNFWNVTDNLGLQGTLAWYSVDSWPHSDMYANATNYVPNRFNASGFGWLLYPKRGDDGHMLPVPVSSARWKLFRTGLEDAELFYAAKRASTALAAKCHCSNITWSSACCHVADAMDKALHRTMDVAWAFYDVGDWR